MRKLNLNFRQLLCLGSILLFVLSPLMSRAQEKTYQGVTFPMGDRSFADAVVDYRLTSENRSASAADPAAVLGPPNAGNRSVAKQNLALGNAKTSCEAYVTVRFDDNYLVDVDGNDLWIFEAGSGTGGVNEPLEVYISTDGFNWIAVGKTGGGKGGIDIRGKTSPGQRFRYVRICDAPGGNTTGSPTPGPDVDAIGAIGSEYRQPTPEDNAVNNGPFSIPPNINDLPPGPIEGTGAVRPEDCGPPWMSFSHDWIDLSREACIQRALEAMRSAGFTSVSNSDIWAIEGKNSTVRAYIHCICTITGVQPQEETLFSVSVAAPENLPGVTGDVRTYLGGYMQNPATAGLPPTITSTSGGLYNPPGNYSFPPVGGGVCDDPRTQVVMDNWLRSAIPPERGDRNFRYDFWGRLVDEYIVGVGPVDTPLSRCEFLWQHADELRSTNLGTLKDYVLQRLNN